MPDNAWQAHTVYGQYGALLAHYRRCPKTLMGVNLLLRYREDGVRYALVPDVFVVFGVTNKKRPSYEIWEEGKAPDFVLEVASKGTYENDLGSKKNTYERMGVREYCVFDPQGDMHRPRLQLFRLEGGVYRSVSGRGRPDGPLAVTSETLGLELRFEDDRMRLWDPEPQEYLMDQHEVYARYEEVRARYEEVCARYEEERTGRLKERARYEEAHASRIAAEQRTRDVETAMADLEARLRSTP